MAAPDPAVFKGADGSRSPDPVRDAGEAASAVAGLSGGTDVSRRAGFDPYYRWLGIPQAEQPPTLYRLLGLSPLEPDLGVIEEAADRQMAHVRAHQNGSHAAESQRLLNELSAAKVTLLHVGKKLAYDRTLRPPAPPPPPPSKAAAPAVTAPASVAAPRPMPSPMPMPMPVASMPMVPIPVPPTPVAPKPITIQASPANSVTPAPLPNSYQGANAPRSPGNVAAPRPVPVPVAAKADPSKMVLRETPADPDEELKRIALKKAPPWAISCIVHMLALIILGLWYIKPESIHKGIFLDVAAPEVGQHLIDDSVALDSSEVSVDDAIVTPADLTKVEDPFAEPADTKEEIALLGSKPVLNLEVPKIEIALMGREPGTKEALLGKYGGNGDTENAVGRALAWLAKQQRKDGTWSLKGPYKSGAMGGDIPESATALALLAFQGAGNTHQRGEYQKQVAKGIYALRRMQGANGDFFQEGGRTNNWFYAHAQATMAICELYGMTKDDELRDPAIKAINFLIESQDP